MGKLIFGLSPVALGAVAVGGYVAISRNAELKQRLQELSGKSLDRVGGGGIIETIQERLQAVTERVTEIRETVSSGTGQGFVQGFFGGGGGAAAGDKSPAPSSGDSSKPLGFFDRIQGQALDASGAVFGTIGTLGSVAVGTTLATPILRGAGSAASIVPAASRTIGVAARSLAPAVTRGAGYTALSAPFAAGLASVESGLGLSSERIRGQELTQKIRDAPIAAQAFGVAFRPSAVKNIPIIGKLFGG